MCVGPNGRKYVGQHSTTDVAKRIRTHRNSYEQYLVKLRGIELSDHKNEPIKGHCTYLCRAFNKYGFDNFKWSILENNIPLDNLDEKEAYYIKEHDTMAPKGYNLLRAGGSKYSALEKSAIASVAAKERSRKILHKFRKNAKELEGLPMHTCFFTTMSGMRGYKITNHPKCKNKQFASETVSIAVLKQNLLHFLARLEKEGNVKSDQEIKLAKGIPKGIIADKKGNYLVQFTYKKRRYNKYFSQSDKSEALKMATEWMNAKKEELKKE
jgi:hypothetical protein